MAASQTTAATNSAASGVLIYDGDCGFCTQAARKFSDFAHGSIDTAPWQSLDLAAYGLTEADCSQAAFFASPTDVYRGADAIAHGLQACAGGWNVLGRIMAVPPVSWLARGIYPVIAKYRHKLPGATNACRIG